MSPATSTRPSAGASTSSSRQRRRNPSFGIAEEEREERRERDEGTATIRSIQTRGRRRKREIRQPLSMEEGMEPCTDRRAKGMSVTLTADGFHPVFQLQLAFLESDFFDLFGFGEVTAWR